MGINTSRTSLIFLLLVAVIVALGLKVTGTFLMGALVIVPAAAAKNVSLNMRTYSLLAGVFGALSGLAGILIATNLHLHPGPIVVLTSGAIFVITLLFKR
jgi:zinc transport system permease protein